MARIGALLMRRMNVTRIVVAVALLALGIVLPVSRFSKLCWQEEQACGGLPCVLKPRSEATFFLTLHHSGLMGFLVPLVTESKPVSAELEIRSVPDGSPLLTVPMALRADALTTRFDPLWLPQNQSFSFTIRLGEGEERLFLRCRRGDGSGRERPMGVVSYAFGEGKWRNVRAWVDARLHPFVPPGALAVVSFLLLFGPGLSLGVAVLVFWPSRRRG